MSEYEGAGRPEVKVKKYHGFVLRGCWKEIHYDTWLADEHLLAIRKNVRIPRSHVDNGKKTC